MSESNSLCCLACLDTDNVFNMFDIHECEGIEENYSEMLKECLDITISRGSNAHGMCGNCITILRSAHYFKQNVLQNLKVLEAQSKQVEYVLYDNSPTKSCDRLTPKNLNESLDADIDWDIDNYTPIETSFAEQENYVLVSFENDIDGDVLNQEERKTILKKPATNKRTTAPTDGSYMERKHVKFDLKVTKDKTKNNRKKQATVKDVPTAKEEFTPEGITTFTCEQCSKVFPSRIAIERHLKIHLTGPFKCHICDQEFSKLNSRNSHVWRVHRTQRPYACAHCTQRFETFHRRLAHLIDAHGATKDYPCPFCRNRYYFAGARSVHVRTVHLREHRHFCECGLGFFKRRDLLAHMATAHDIGEKKFQCPICSKRFYRNPVLQYHIKQTHHKQKYVCKICNSRFVSKSLLINHLKWHKLHCELDLSDTQLSTEEKSESIRDDVCVEESRGDSVVVAEETEAHEVVYMIVD